MVSAYMKRSRFGILQRGEGGWGRVPPHRLVKEPEVEENMYDLARKSQPEIPAGPER